MTEDNIPKVSVIIPTYKRKSATVINTLNSAYRQTYENFEVILVDDNEDYVISDEIKSLKNIYPELVILSEGKNRGACVARNTGIMKAKGEYVAFLDDDDTWEPTKIEKQMQEFRQADIGLVYCGIRYTNEKNGKSYNIYAKSSNNPCRELLIENFIGSTSCGIVKRSSAIQVGMFDANLKSGQDLDFWYRIAENYKLAYTKECLLNYTIYNNNTITANPKNRLDSNIYLMNKYSNVIKADKELNTVYFLKITKSFMNLKKYREMIRFLFLNFNIPNLSLKYIVKYTYKNVIK